MISSLIRSTAGRVVVVFMMCILPLAQALELGAMSMAHVPAKSMSTIAFSTSPKVFSRFAMAVGGVAFTNTATSTDGSKILGLVYNASAPDGARLRIKVETADGKVQTLPLEAPDWIHIPLARFVASDATGAVTLFGELEDAAQERRFKEENHAMIANYHPALKDTLLGLRLLQADMLIIENNATDLFKDKGKYILGKGEAAPSQQDLRRNHAGFTAVKHWIGKQSEEFTSYVTGDVGSTIQYSVTNEKLNISGTPNWYCWRHNDKKIDDAVMRNARTMSSDAFVIFSIRSLDERIKKAVLDRLRTTSAASEEARDAAAKKSAELVVKKTAGDILSHPESTGKLTLIKRAELERAYSVSDTKEIYRLFKSAIGQLNSIEEKDERIDKIRQEFSTLSQANEKAAEQVAVIQMKKYSEALSVEIRKAGGINPPVFDALQKSVHIAAVMRAAKAKDPDGYKQYVASIKQVPLKFSNPPGYVLQTPTVYPRE